MRGMIAAALLAAGLAGPVSAQSVGALTIDAPTAQGLVGAGGILVDIRTPREVRDTGSPPDAKSIPLQGDDLTFRSSFVQDVLAAAGGDPKRPVALIDSGGRRSDYAARLLGSQGFTEASSVGEGLFGSNLGPGWVRRGLPMEKHAP